MATLDELRGIMDDSRLTGKIESAIVIAVEAIRTEAAETANHANRIKWAKAVLEPGRRLSVAKAMQSQIVGRHAELAASGILGAADIDIKQAVTDAVNIFADGS